MRLIKLFFTFIVLALMIPCGVQSQNTAPMPTTFEILKPADRAIYFAEGMVQARNTYGSPVRWVSALNDSVGRYLKHVERHWKMGIVSIGALSPDTGDITVTVHTRDPKGEDLIMPYTATLKAHQQIEVNNANWIPGISIMMDDSVTAQYAVGDSFEIVYLERSFSPHAPVSRLTIAPAWSDTLTSNGDTLYGLAVAGHLPVNGLFIKGICSSGVDDFGDSWIGLGYQNKFIGEGWGSIHVISDSFYIPQDEMKDTTFTPAGLADSLRPVTWGNTLTTNFYFEFIKWLGAN